MKSKSGKIVSKKKHEAGVKAMKALRRRGLAAAPYRKRSGLRRSSRRRRRSSKR